MKKIVVILLVVMMMVGCSKKDEFGLGVYKERHYTNEIFNLDFEIPKEFSFLTKEELDVRNKQVQEAENAAENSKYFNNVINISSLSGAKLIAYVDSTPGLTTTEEKEANEYLDFLSNSGIAYSLDKGTQKINDLEYFKLSLKLDFDGMQDTYIAISEGKLINIQITYTKETVEVAQELLEMIGANE